MALCMTLLLRAHGRAAGGQKGGGGGQGEEEPEWPVRGSTPHSVLSFGAVAEAVAKLRPELDHAVLHFMQ